MEKWSGHNATHSETPPAPGPCTEHKAGALDLSEGVFCMNNVCILRTYLWITFRYQVQGHQNNFAIAHGNVSDCSWKIVLADGPHFFETSKDIIAMTLADQHGAASSLSLL